MFEVDATQLPVASQEQPTDELAVSADPAVELVESSTDEAPVSTETAEPIETTEQLILGKYKSNEEVYKALQHSTSEASRMANELSAYKRGVQDARPQQSQAAEPATPKYSVDQLEYAKVDLLTNLAAAQAQGDAQKARELAGNVAWCDREIRKQEFASLTQQHTAKSAESQIMSDALTVVQKYQADIQAGPGNPLYDKAAALHSTYLAMGQPDNNLTRAQAIALAANLLGKDATGVAQTSRKELTTTLQKSLKAAVQAGTGKASVAAAANPDFENMTDAEFTTWKAKHLK